MVRLEKANPFMRDKLHRRQVVQACSGATIEVTDPKASCLQQSLTAQ